MANINKISVAGTIYDLQDKNAAKTVELTQAEYDGLAVKEQNVFYIITDAQGGDLSNYYTKGETDTLLDGKQPTLVSGTNIKTINNESILGEGNLDIQGGDLSNYYTKGETDTLLGEKQPTLVSGTNIKTINNESLLGEGNINIQGGGGGKAVNAGTNISIITGETADTINCTLPIYTDGTGEGSMIGGYSGNIASGKYAIAFGGRYEGRFDYCYCKATNKGSISFGGESTGQGSFTCGESTKASGINAVAIGCYLGEASGNYSFITGRQNIGQNDCEFVVGKLAESNKASTTFGDSGNTLFIVGNGTSTDSRHNAFEIRQNGDIYCSDGTNDVKLQDTITATAANTAALGGLKLVKLSQSEYDGLQTKDPNTLYIING